MDLLSLFHEVLKGTIILIYVRLKNKSFLLHSCDNTNFNLWSVDPAYRVNNLRVSVIFPSQCPRARCTSASFSCPWKTQVQHRETKYFGNSLSYLYFRMKCHVWVYCIPRSYTGGSWAQISASYPGLHCFPQVIKANSVVVPQIIP
jgi:hypothetical protein